MKSHAIKLSAVLLTIALGAGPASADLYFKTQSQGGGENANEQIAIVAEGYVDGPRGQVYIRESSNPMMRTGTYLYTPDGGNTVFLVDPAEETVSEIDIAGMMKFAGAVLESLGPVVNIEISDPQVKVLSQGPGPSKLGLKTSESKIDSRYAMSIGVIGIKRRQEVHEVSTILTTKDLDGIATSMWFRNDPPKIGHPELDKLSNNAFAQVDGTVIALRVDSTVIGKKGKEQRSWSEFELLELDQSAGGPPGGYGYPDHYQVVELLPTAEMAGEQPQEEEEKKGRFGGLFKKKDGG